LNLGNCRRDGALFLTDIPFCFYDCNSHYLDTVDISVTSDALCMSTVILKEGFPSGKKCDE